mmetsp:Transcript_22604/g.33153  ORF Transcript_22604/g.33153 Transcript_22604/m.33153 type:complete len:200 (-) Transcript_22604:1317-1916(-)
MSPEDWIEMLAGSCPSDGLVILNEKRVIFPASISALTITTNCPNSLFHTPVCASDNPFIPSHPDSGAAAPHSPEMVMFILSCAYKVSCEANKTLIVFDWPVFGVDCEIEAMSIVDTMAKGARILGSVRTATEATGTSPKISSVIEGETCAATGLYTSNTSRYTSRGNTSMGILMCTSYPAVQTTCTSIRSSTLHASSAP